MNINNELKFGVHKNEDDTQEFSDELVPDLSKNNIEMIKLSEEDLEALKLGRELLKKKTKKEDNLYEIHREYHKHLEYFI